MANYPNIQINSATGSDSAASGAGPATAVTGSLAATHSNTTVNITDAVSLAGVDTTGLAALWINTASGRQWAKITNIAGSSGAYTVTVDSAYGVTASGQTWAIGGKRATQQGSAKVFKDFEAGWNIDPQSDETFTATIEITPSNQTTATPSTIISSKNPKPQITVGTNSVHAYGISACGNLTIGRLYLICTAGTPGNGFNAQNGHSTGPVCIEDCIIEAFNTGIQCNNNGANYRIEDLYLESTTIRLCTFRGIDSIDTIQCVNCTIVNNAQEGIHVSGSNTNQMVLIGCVVNYNGNTSTGFSGVTCGSGVNHVILRNNDFCFNGNGSTGVGFGTTSGGNNYNVIVEGNIAYGNKDYGISFGSQVAAIANRCNGYGANNGGGVGLDRSNFGVGPGDQNLTGSPFVSTTDFALNATSGAGALCRQNMLSYGELNQSATALPADIGAVQSGTASVATSLVGIPTAAEQIPQSVARRVPFQAYQSADHRSAATGATIAVTISKNGAAYANPAGGAVNATEIGHGSYYVDLGTGDTGTVGPLIVRGTASGVDDVLAFYDVTAPTHQKVTKNTQLNAFPFPMVLSDHITPATGKTVTGKVSKNGAAEVTLTNSAAIFEIGSGSYACDLAATDTNGDTLVLRFSATGCDDCKVYIATQP